MTTIALAIPHTPWVTERAISMGAIRDALHIHGTADGIGADSYREFTDRAPNSVWCVEMWEWLANTGADWCLQLQDDVMVSPSFWPALRAMLASLPADADVVGLTSTHPMAPEIARQGHRWYRTPGNLVGWAYCIRRTALVEFLAIRSELPETFRAKNEDDQIAEWAAKSNRGVWHPVPAIVDHDTSIPSSYKNDDHSHRRPQVTWRDFPEASLCDASWWIPSGTTHMLPMPSQFDCWGCGQEPQAVRFPTGVRLGRQCVANLFRIMASKL